MCNDDPGKFCCDGTCCDNGKCCDNGTCVDKCIEGGGDKCDYELSSAVACQINNIDDLSCAEWPCTGPGCEDGFCQWSVSGSSTNNDICRPGCPCELHSEPCVIAYAKTCQDSICWFPLPYVCCECLNPGGLNDPVPFGTRSVCGAEP